MALSCLSISVDIFKSVVADVSCGLIFQVLFFCRANRMQAHKLVQFTDNELKIRSERRAEKRNTVGTFSPSFCFCVNVAA